LPFVFQESTSQSSVLLYAVLMISVHIFRTPLLWLNDPMGGQAGLL
jgi:hypothetical protein